MRTTTTTQTPPPPPHTHHTHTHTHSLTDEQNRTKNVNPLTVIGTGIYHKQRDFKTPPSLIRPSRDKSHRQMQEKSEGEDVFKNKNKNKATSSHSQQIAPPPLPPQPIGDDDVRAVATCGERPADIAAAVFQCQRDAITYQSSGTAADQTAPVTSALSRPAATT